MKGFPFLPRSLSIPMYRGQLHRSVEVQHVQHLPRRHTIMGWRLKRWSVYHVRNWLMRHNVIRLQTCAPTVVNIGVNFAAVWFIAERKSFRVGPRVSTGEHGCTPHPVSATALHLTAINEIIEKEAGKVGSRNGTCSPLFVQWLNPGRSIRRRGLSTKAVTADQQRRHQREPRC